MRSISEEDQETKALFAEAYMWRDANRNRLASEAEDQMAKLVKQLDEIFFWFGPAGGLTSNVIKALDGLSYNSLSGDDLPEPPVVAAADFLERVHAERIEAHPEYGLYLEDLISEMQSRLERRKQADQESIDAWMKALYGVTE